MTDIKRIADKADMIVNGYAFTHLAYLLKSSRREEVPRYV